MITKNALSSAFFSDPLVSSLSSAHTLWYCVHVRTYVIQHTRLFTAYLIFCWSLSQCVPVDYCGLNSIKWVNLRRIKWWLYTSPKGLLAYPGRLLTLLSVITFLPDCLSLHQFSSTFARGSNCPRPMSLLSTSVTA